MAARKATSVGSRVASKANSATAIIEGITEVAKAVRAIAEERTKRAEIEAKARVEIKKVEAIRDVMLRYLDQSFDERRANFAALFARVDAAMAAGHLETAAVALDSVVKLAQQSPFKDLVSLDAARRALKDKSKDWEF